MAYYYDWAKTVIPKYASSYIANNVSPRVLNGDHLTRPGVSMHYKLFAHQKRAIWRDGK